MWKGAVYSQTGKEIYHDIIEKVLHQNIPFSNYDLIIGQDEVGNGEIIGPVVIGSVGVG